MKLEQLIDKLLAHLVTQVAPKLTDPLKKFKIGLLGGESVVGASSRWPSLSLTT